MIRARFFVAGDPAPQGSKRIVQPKGHRRPLLLEMSKKLPAWRKAVAAEATIARQRLSAPLADPVALHLAFFLRPPKRLTRAYPSIDLDKMVRAVGDSLVHGALIEDDRQVVKIVATKVWASANSVTGCSVILADP